MARMLGQFGQEENSRKIETFDDALFVMVGCIQNCSGVPCEECGVYLFGERGKRSCDQIKAEAKKIIAEHMGMSVDQEGLSAQKAAFEWLMGASGSEMPLVPCEGTCATCQRSAFHPSGIRWCKSFGNFVHEDEACSRWEGAEEDAGL